MKDKNNKYFLLHIVIYSTESIEFFVSIFADIVNVLIKEKFIIKSYI